MADADKSAAPTAQAEETFTRHIESPGLSKREVAAIAAMQGLLAHGAHKDLFEDGVARLAVAYADALFAELAKGAQA